MWKCVKEINRLINKTKEIIFGKESFKHNVKIWNYLFINFFIVRLPHFLMLLSGHIAINDLGFEHP